MTSVPPDQPSTDPQSNGTAPSTPPATAYPASQALAVVAARAADDKKAEDILVLNVGDLLSITEYFVIASASNRRLVRTVVDAIDDEVRERNGRSPLRVEGLSEQQWVLMDYGDVVVHVFTDELRAYYEIERLYRDVHRVDWRP